MDATAARAWLEIETQHTVAPGLTVGEITHLLSFAAIVDVALFEPTAVGWVPTYGTAGLNVAAARGWRIKAGKLTTMMDVAAGSAKAALRQRWENAMAMSRVYGGGGGVGIGSITVVSTIKPEDI